MLSSWSITCCISKIGGELATRGCFLECLDGAHFWFILDFFYMVPHLTQNFICLIAFFSTHLQIITKMHFSSSLLCIPTFSSLSSSFFFMRPCDWDLVTLRMVLNYHIASSFLLLFLVAYRKNSFFLLVGHVVCAPVKKDRAVAEFI